MVKVTFDYNNGEQPLVLEVKKNSKIDRPTVEPVRNNYLFDDWYLGEKRFEFNKTKVKKDITILAKWGLNIDGFDEITQAIIYHANSTNFNVVGTGTIDASVIVQSLHYEKSRNGDSISLFNGSYGEAKILFIPIKVQPYIKVTGNINNVTLEKGDVNKNMEVEKIKSSEYITYDKYRQLYGVGLNDLNYIINESTILKVVKTDNDTYKINLDLVESVKNYTKNISEMNPEENKRESIKFKNLEIEIKLDNKNRLETISYVEQYSIEVKIKGLPKWMEQNVTSKITEKYTYN